MKAFAIDSYKAALRPRELPDPVAGPGEVVVAIAAASVNPLDVKLREGAFKLILPYSMPLVLGHDLAGTVIAVGPATRRFKVGDEVFGRAGTKHIGSFAERIAVAEADLAFKPATLSMTEAAALPLVSLTAWQVLVERARLRPGQRVLVHAGSGGVGTVAIQLARHLGAQVATTVGPDNLVLAKELGADVVIDYRHEAFEQRLSGYDVVLDTQGGDVLHKSMKVLKAGGKLISIAGPPDPRFAREIGAGWVVQPAAAAGEPQAALECEEAGRRLLVPLHACRRRPARRDCKVGRCRRDPAGHRPGVLLRREPGSLGAGGLRTRAWQGCHPRRAGPVPA